MTRLRGRRSNNSLPAFLILLIALGTGTLLEYLGITHLLPRYVKDGSFLRDRSELVGQPVIATLPSDESQKVGQGYA